MSEKTNAQIALEAASRVFEGVPYHNGDTASKVMAHADMYLRWLVRNS